MIVTMCAAVSTIDPAILKQIETVANNIQESLEVEIDHIPENDKTNCDPMSVLNTVFSSMNNSSSQEEALKNIEGINPEIGNAVQKIIPNIIAALNTVDDPVKSKQNLLDQFANIDGETALQK